MNPMANPGGDAVPDLEPLLAAWGVKITDGEVIGDQNAAQRVTARVSGRQVVADYLPWLSLGPDHLRRQRRGDRRAAAAQSELGGRDRGRARGRPRRSSRWCSRARWR